MPDPGHGLPHTLLFEFALEHLTGVLEASVAVEDWLCIRITLDGLFISIEYQLIVISGTYNPGDRIQVIQIKDRTQIELVYSRPLIPLEFRHIRCPFFIGCFGIEISV